MESIYACLFYRCETLHQAIHDTFEQMLLHINGQDNHLTIEARTELHQLGGELLPRRADGTALTLPDVPPDDAPPTVMRRFPIILNQLREYLTDDNWILYLAPNLIQFYTMHLTFPPSIDEENGFHGQHFSTILNDVHVFLEHADDGGNH